MFCVHNYVIVLGFIPILLKKIFCFVFPRNIFEGILGVQNYYHLESMFQNLTFIFADYMVYLLWYKTLSLYHCIIVSFLPPPNMLIRCLLKWLFIKNLQDLKKKPKYLAAFSVGIDQMNNIDACVKKVQSMDPIFHLFCILLCCCCCCSNSIVFLHVLLR